MACWDRGAQRVRDQCGRGWLGRLQVPPHFGEEDLFSVLGAARPDYRWLIVGPARSGSSFHKDPNQVRPPAAARYLAHILRRCPKWPL